MKELSVQEFIVHENAINDLQKEEEK